MYIGLYIPLYPFFLLFFMWTVLSELNDLIDLIESYEMNIINDESLYTKHHIIEKFCHFAHPR